MHTATVTRRTKKRFNPSDGRDELNLAEFPIALLTDRVPDGQKTLEFQDTILEPRTHNPVIRKLIITAADKYGLPTAKDDEVILGCMQLTKLHNNFTDPLVYFSRSDLVHLLRWPHSGQSFRRVEESLYRWLTVTLFYNRAWWDKTTSTWVDENFHIIDRVTLYDNERFASQRTLPFSSFTWNQVIFRSLQAGNLKRLDLDFYLGLTTSTAKRLFRFLDKRFYLGPRWEFDLHQFAFEHVGLSRSYNHTGVLKQKLAPAIDELEQKGILEPLPAGDRFIQVRRGEWKIVFLKKQSATEEKPAIVHPSGLERS